MGFFSYFFYKTYTWDLDSEGILLQDTFKINYYNYYGNSKLIILVQIWSLKYWKAKHEMFIYKKNVCSTDATLDSVICTDR